MNEELKKLGQEFAERNRDNFLREEVSHTPEAIKEFADLTARLVETEEQPHLTIHRPLEQYMVRARIWSAIPMIELDVGHPDKGSQKEIFVAETFLREKSHDIYSRINDAEELLGALNGRNVATEGNTLQTNGWFCNEVQRYALSVKSTTQETSRIAQLVCEALQKGTPLGETEPRPENMKFSHYSAGVGRIGTPRRAQGWGYVLENGEEIYIVSSMRGSFVIDQNNHVLRTLGGIETMCYGCDFAPLDLADKLETTFEERNLDGKSVFFVGNYTGPSEGACCGDMVYKAKEVLEERGATVYATEEEAKNLL